MQGQWLNDSEAGQISAPGGGEFRVGETYAFQWWLAMRSKGIQLETFHHKSSRRPGQAHYIILMVSIAPFG